jgi:hypothetical protein
MSAPTYEAGGYKNITATGNVSPQPATIIGFLCSTTTAGTIQFYDSAATATTTPITGVITPAAGSFTPIKASAGAGIYAVIGGTINVTVVFA